MSLFAGDIIKPAELVPARTQAQLLKECQDNASFWKWMFWGFIIALGVILLIVIIIAVSKRSKSNQAQGGYTGPQFVRA